MPSIVSIDDPEDPRIEGYRQVRERDLVGRDGGFIAEGEVVLRAWLGSGRHAVVSVLLADKRVSAIQPLLTSLPDDVVVFQARQAVMDQIVGFHIHRGVLALGRRAPDFDITDFLSALGPRATLVVLLGVANHDNVGGIFRNAAAFGADAVLLDHACCDPLYRKAIRVSVGGALTVPFVRFGSSKTLIDDLASHDFEVISLSPAGASPLSHVRRSGRMALLLGAEGSGLPPEVLERTRTVSIPMAGAFDSLNVATTSGIALHHLMADGQGPPESSRPWGIQASPNN